MIGNSEELLDTAKRAAVAASEIHRRYSANGFVSNSKDRHHDMVTSADIDSEKAVIEIIRETYPDHNIIAEEDTYEKRNSPYTWIIDPLDGTNNFFKGVPHYAVSIGVAYENRLIAGVVRNSAHNELFFGLENRGAFLNDTPIAISSQASLTNALLFTGFHYDRGEQMRNTLKCIEHFFNQGIIGIRRSGCAALDLCYVAAGRGDGFWEHYLSPWDFSAASLILSEAGGIVTDFQGKDNFMKKGPIIAANKELHRAILEEVNKIY